MNLLLLHPREVDRNGRAVLHGRRAAHVAEVLGAEPGRVLRCGLLDGPLGFATVVATSTDRVEVVCTFDAAAPPPGTDALLLAVPRPKVLRRAVEHAVALGYGTIVLMRTWRVDRSHLESQAMALAALEPHVIAGLEQSRRTRLPRLLIEPLFKPFVEDRLDALIPAADRFVADPDAPTDVATVRPHGGWTLAIGPERGFTRYEVERLEAIGFRAVHGGPHPLRVETAIAALSGQLRALRAVARADS